MKTILMLIVGLMLAGCGSMETDVRHRHGAVAQGKDVDVRHRDGAVAQGKDVERDVVDALCACP